MTRNQRLAPAGVEALGVVDPRVGESGGEDDGRGDDRAGQRAASGLVDPRDQPEPPPPQLPLELPEIDERPALLRRHGTGRLLKKAQVQGARRSGD